MYVIKVWLGEFLRIYVLKSSDGYSLVKFAFCRAVVIFGENFALAFTDKQAACIRREPCFHGLFNQRTLA